MSHKNVQKYGGMLLKQFDSLSLVLTFVPSTRDACLESLLLDEVPAGAIGTAEDQPKPIITTSKNV